MTVYADSSVLVAWFHPADEFALPVTSWLKDNGTGFCWNAILQAEVRHNLRKLKTSYARTAWNAFRAAEKSGRLILGREKLSDLLEDADNLSSEMASAISAGTWDFFHVAAAMRMRADVFATCDNLQAQLATEAWTGPVKQFRS
jgi:predicted nucleic acid-binding protein